MLDQPGEGYLGEQNNFLYNPSNNNLIYNAVVDKSWEIFLYIGRIHMWDGFVYLFLLVWNSEPDNSLLDSELSLIEGHLLNLHTFGATSKDKGVATDEIIKQYKECRNTNNEALRNEVMGKVYYHLSHQSIYGQPLTNIILLLNSMNYLQKQALRHVFISRIYGYAKFAEYLSKVWVNKPTDVTKENDQLLIKENQTRIIETGLRQFLNLSNQNEKSYAESVRIENNTINKQEETTRKSLIDEISDKNSEIVKPAPDSTEFVKTKEESAGKKMEIMDNVEIKKKEEPEFVNDKEDNIESNKDDKDKVENTSKEKIRIGKKSNKSSQNRNSSYKLDSIKVEKLQQEIEALQENKKSEVDKLQQEIDALRQEAAKHQAALGVIMNVGWRDDDSNNSMQLTKDIEKLQKDLADFTRVKRGGIKINNDAVRTLFQSLKCKTLVENKTNAKLVLSAALQRKLINHTLNHMDDYFNRTTNDLPNKVDLITDDKLEAAIFSKTNQLIELTERFTKVNTGTDAHTKMLPIKIRQHIYAALGERGFVDSNHPLIKKLVDENLNGMNKHRTIDDEEKNKKINSEAAIIIRQILHYFYFRLQTQEPKPSIKFYESGEEFDHSVMESVGQIKNDEEEDNEELEVEICSFPAIALLENLDEEKRRVFTKAQVIVRPKKSV
ncbi:14982_t:CDS:2 [Rhizophagus irregularis]|nr:14982_t:CDS:2 [Rhizophagus irregularis]